MPTVGLKVVIVILALLYTGVGIVTLVELHKRGDHLTAWTLLAGLWLFLAVGIWRLSRIARTASVTFLWLVVLGAIVLVLQPGYFPQMNIVPQLKSLQRAPEMLVGLVGLSLIAMWILSKNRDEFR